MRRASERGKADTRKWIKPALIITTGLLLRFALDVMSEIILERHKRKEEYNVSKGLHPDQYTDRQDR